MILLFYVVKLVLRVLRFVFFNRNLPVLCFVDVFTVALGYRLIMILCHNLT